MTLSRHKRRLRMQEVLRRLRLAMPEPRCELIYHSPFQLLVSVVLSAKNTDKQVNKVMEPLYTEHFTPETVLAWGVEGLLARIKSIGLAPTKARNIFALSQLLIERFQGQIPRQRADLESLPGVGRKTANVVLGEIFREPTLAVDTHVYRVTKRLGLQDASNAAKAEQELLECIDPNDLPMAHHWLLLHGRYVCKALKPDCAACVINDLCPSAQVPAAKRKTLSTSSPATGLM